MLQEHGPITPRSAEFLDHHARHPAGAPGRHELMRPHGQYADPSVIGLLFAIALFIASLFVSWDPAGIFQGEPLASCIVFLVVIVTGNVLTVYAGGFLILYLARQSSARRVCALLAAGGGGLAWLCLGNVYVSHYVITGRQSFPGSMSLLSMYFANALGAIGSLELAFYVSRCRARDVLGRDGAPDDGRRVDRAHEQERSGALATNAGSAAARAGAGDPHGGTPPARSSRLVDRVTDSIGTDVVYAHVSGHYLEVVTVQGSMVVIASLADAVAEFGDHGMQVHRSYWVSYNHVVRLHRRDHRIQLLLSDGQEIPVSRLFLPAVHDWYHNRDSTPDPHSSGTPKA